MRTCLAALIVCVALLSTGVLCLDNGLGMKPQMGWNSWNLFGCDGLNEQLVRDTADAMVSSGLAAVGYEYINMDDCWMVSRDSAGRLIADPKRFPSGIFQLAQYVHSKNLKFGLYSSAGTNTCAGRPASLNHEVMDALVFAAWEVDYLKLDNCNNQGIPERTRYPIMRDALNATGRPIFFSLCVDNPATWAATVGNSWRTTGDINAHWGSIIGNANQSNAWWSYAGPGHWNDPDMLEVGNGGLTYDQNVAHFSLWALIKSPLLLGNDLRSLPPQVASILSNKEVIAVNQDSLGVQGHKLTSVNGAEVWAGPLADGSQAVVLLNIVANPQQITVRWTDLGFPATASATVRDLWLKQDIGTFTGNYSTMVNGTASVMIRVIPSAPVKIVPTRPAVVARRPF